MPKSKSKQMAERSIEALSAAVGVYNRPSEPYRIEQFTILLCNAWELVLKARILQLNKSKFSAIAVYEKRYRADGTQSKKLYLKRTRCGNAMTIGLLSAFDRLNEKNAEGLPSAVRKNIEAVTEIRDTAIHFVHVSGALVVEQHEVFAASVDNFLKLLRKWFRIGFDELGPNFLPLAFLGHHAQAAAHASENRLIRFLQQTKSSTAADETDQFHIGLLVTVEAKKSSASTAAQYRLTRDPEAQALRLEEDDLRERFPWTYKQVAQRCRDRYSDFLQNKQFNDAIKKAKKDPNLFHRRLLDTENPRSGGKDYYSSNVMAFLDKFWTRKEPRLGA